MKSMLVGMVFAAAWAFPALAAPAYTLTQTILLGAPDRWDYLTFDTVSNRVLASHASQTDIVDAASFRVIGHLNGLQGAHGQTVATTGDIYADSGQTGTVTVFDAHSFKPIATIPAGADADGVLFEPKYKLVVVLDGDPATATLIDSTTRSVKATVALGGGPEFGAADGAGHIYVNIADNSEIVQIDAATAKVTARYPVTGCESPHGMAMDPKTRRLFSTCLNGKMFILDADSGRVLQTLPIGHGTDAAAFDPVRRRVFSSNGEGTLSVMQEQADGSVTALGDVKTAQGARTLAVDPASGNVFVVTADVAGTRPAGHGGLVPKFAFRPSSVKMLVFAPK